MQSSLSNYKIIWSKIALVYLLLLLKIPIQSNTTHTACSSRDPHSSWSHPEGCDASLELRMNWRRTAMALNQGWNGLESIQVWSLFQNSYTLDVYSCEDWTELNKQENNFVLMEQSSSSTFVGELVLYGQQLAEEQDSLQWSTHNQLAICTLRIIYLIVWIYFKHPFK